MSTWLIIGVRIGFGGAPAKTIPVRGDADGGPVRTGGESQIRRADTRLIKGG